MSRELHDTIVAVATPPGQGALAVVRMSGPSAGDVLRSVCPGLDGLPPPRRATLASLRDPDDGEVLDRVLVTWFPAPGSYTGEDVAEISGHGGSLTPLMVLEACRAAGARTAEPGEFTRRALANGKLDLVQAEAVADLVESRSRAAHRAALHQLDRGLSRRIDALHRGLVELEALLVHHIDFPEEDDAPAPVGVVAGRARELGSALAALAATAPEGERLRVGALAVLAGRPNTGKSSLFNALVGEERALVTEIPGTTRDALEAQVSLGGYPFRLVDTAGLRADSPDRIERMGIEVARRFLDAADVVLFCAHADRELDGDERRFVREEGERRPVVVLRTLADRVPEGSDDGDGPASPRPAGEVEAPDGAVAQVEVSAWTGSGMDRLRHLLPELAFRGLVESRAEAPVLTRRRQAKGVEKAREEVEAFARALDQGVPAEVAASHLRSAETALEEVVGVITTEEVLDHLFRTFCIGK